MSVYALDTNIISFYLRGNAIVIANVEKAINDGNSIVIPPLVYYEVKRGLMLINATKKLEEFEVFCELFPVGELSNYLLENQLKYMCRKEKQAEIPKTLIYLSPHFAFTIIISLLQII